MKIKLLYFGTFQDHCSDKYRIKGFESSNFYDVKHFDYRDLYKMNGNNFVNVTNEIVKSYKPTVIFINKGELITGDQIKGWKKILPNVLVIYWYGDMRSELQSFVLEKAGVVDIFAINNKDEEIWKDLYNHGAKKIFYSHTATDVEIFRKNLSIKSSYDLAFFGGNYGDKFEDSIYRYKYIKKLIEETDFKIRIHGKNWDEFKKYSNVDVFPVVYGKDYANACSSSKIILGFSSFLNKDHYTSNRIFNSMACGFYLCHKFKGFDKMFGEAVHCASFEDYSEMLQKINFYLQNDYIRNETYQNGRFKIYDNHTYKVRAREFYFEILKYMDAI